jgi:hypothetical protein
MRDDERRKKQERILFTFMALNIHDECHLSASYGDFRAHVLAIKEIYVDGKCRDAELYPRT